MSDIGTAEEEFENWLDRQLTGDLATGNVGTELRMAVSTIRNMPNIPKDFAVQPLKRFMEAYTKKAVLEARKDEIQYVYADNGGTVFFKSETGYDVYKKDRIAELNEQLTNTEEK